MKSVIVYYSYSGNNESLAKELRLRFESDIVRIEEQKKRTIFNTVLDLILGRDAKIQNPDIFLDDYETIIFIAPIWDSKIATPLKSFIKMARDNIKNYAFITVCGGREGQKQKITEELTQLVGKRPITVVELEIRSVLPPSQENDIKSIGSYRITDNDFCAFKKPIQNFVNTVFSYTIKRAERRALMTVG